MKFDAKPPIASRKPHTLEKHGDVRQDPYYWLRDRTDQEVLDYLYAENDYTESVMSDLDPLRDQLYKEMRSRVKEDEQTVPYLSNGYYYYKRFEKGSEYPIYCRKIDLDAEEEILINGNERAGDFDFYSLGSFAVSPNNRYMAFTEDFTGRRIYTLGIKDLETGEILEDTITGTSGSSCWANDNETLFYTLRDAQTLRAHRVMRHFLGGDTASDEVVFDETDESYYTGVYRSKSDRYLLIFSSSTLTSEFRFLHVDDPKGYFQVIHPREQGVEYDVSHRANEFFIRTNADGATNFKLMSTYVSDTNRKHWREVIPHRDDVLLESFMVFADHLVTQERVLGISELSIRSFDEPEQGRIIPFDEEAHGVWFSTNEVFETDTLRFTYTSMTTPPSTFDYDMKLDKRVLLKEKPVLGGFDKSHYDSERIWIEVRDGVKVPVSMVYRKGFERNGQAPLLLYGYGSYGHSLDPFFSANRLSLLDRGFVFALAHIRGGEELGRSWYEDGKLLKKKNTFNDFIDCGEALVQMEYTSKDRLFAMGGSAGGLLMGAIMNARPDLWKGVVAAVPFVDVVTTMLDESIPLTTFEYDEWGNPNERQFYDYIKSYSPYDNVADKPYPNLLITTGLHDSQVQYWEPAKWVAKLRHRYSGKNVILLYTNMDAGHGGASGRFKVFHEIALDYAFLLDLAGITE